VAFIRQQRHIFREQIKQMRVTINSHLITLEQNILQDLDDTEDKIKSKIDNLFQIKPLGTPPLSLPLPQ
jgi:hypothetical protein